MQILNLPVDNSHNASKADDEAVSKWLVDADIDTLQAEGDLDALRAIDRKQRILVRQYHIQHREQEIKSRDPSRAYAWLNLLEAIRG